jgi:segregation and condensation protein A
MTYKVQLDIFEGPLDLLLHLIKKDEVDVYDIPIADITRQYLEYIDILKDMNLNLAGEFLLMAATLTHIKSRMLLPIEGEELGEEEGPDPREELVRMLLEYQRYKDAAVELGDRLRLGRDVFGRGAEVSLDADDEPALVDVSLFDLMGALKSILEGAPKESTLELTVERFSLADKINHVLEILAEKGSATFVSLFPENATKGEMIVTFLAILELAKLVLIKVHQTGDGIIRVYPSNRPGNLKDAREINRDSESYV